MVQRFGTCTTYLPVIASNSRGVETVCTVKAIIVFPKMREQAVGAEPVFDSYVYLLCASDHMYCRFGICLRVAYIRSILHTLDSCDL